MQNIGFVFGKKNPFKARYRFLCVQLKAIKGSKMREMITVFSCNRWKGRENDLTYFGNSSCHRSQPYNYTYIYNTYKYIYIYIYICIQERFRVEKHFSIVIDHKERKKQKYKYYHLLHRYTSHRFRQDQGHNHRNLKYK